MDTARRQRTIARGVAVSGFGYWSGADVRVEFRPAEAHVGRVFVRRDLPGCPRIPVALEHRVDGPLRTSLRCGEAQVDMVEHVLSALVGLGIDNCEVWVDAAEMPGCDGSALPFVEALISAGVCLQDALVRRLVVQETIRLGDAEHWIEARPPLGPRSSFRYHLDYSPSPIGRQVYETALSPEVFAAEVAPARTFVLRGEAERLLAEGKCRRATARDLLVYDETGPIENQPRFPDECARHKVLDMIGDLALARAELAGRFAACRSGHRLNAELVRALAEQAGSVRQWRRCA